MAAPSSLAVVVERLRRFFGHFPQPDLVLARMDQLMAYQCSGEEPQHLMVLGDPGTGKSTLLKAFQRKHPRIDHAEFSELPVLYAEVPSNCSIKKLAGVMLQRMGSRFWNKGTEEDRTYQLQTLLGRCRVRLVILDEINHAVDRGRERTHETVADWIKQQATQAGVSFVLAGIGRSRLLLEANAQFADRFREVMELRPLGVGSPDQLEEFAIVMDAFTSLMTGFDTDLLTTEQTLQKLAFATAGRLRDIRQLLVRGVELADRMPRRRIDQQVLGRAFTQVIFPSATPQQNPFDAKFRGTPLVRPGEPFAPTSR